MHCPSFADIFIYRTTNFVVLAQLDAIKTTATRFREESLVDREDGGWRSVKGFDTRVDGRLMSHHR
jgi:hypothetical protein